MRIDVKKTEVFKFEELTEEGKQAAIENLYDINVGYDWWDGTYDDAESIGLKINGFDTDRGNYIEGRLLLDHRELAEAILKNHGDTCETYQLSETFIKEYDEIVETSPKDENGEHENEYELDQKLDALEVEFERAIKEEYLSILKREYEYLTGEEAIKETIECNEYEFTVDGKLF